MSKVKIYITAPGCGTVFIDGREVDVRSLTLTAGVGAATVLTLVLPAETCEIEAAEAFVMHDGGNPS